MGIPLQFKENMAMNLWVDGRKEERTVMPSFECKTLCNKENLNKKNKKVTPMTLRADKNAFLNPISLKKFVYINPPFWYQKRVSLSGFSRKCLKQISKTGIWASMTVEAAFIFSLFLIAVLNLFSTLEFIRLQSSMEAAFHQVGKKMMIYGYAYEKSGLQLEEYPLASVLFSYSYVKANVEQYAGREYLDNTVLKDGRAGIFYGQSKIMEEDYIDLVALYEVNGVFSYPGLKSIPMYNRIYGHVWNGYNVEKQAAAGEEEIYVFITQSGTVYHRNRNCTYLNPSVEAVYYETVKEKRNIGGEKYYACERCGDKGKTVVYITEQGNRYHASLECSGLKRTIYAVKLSEVGERPPCSKCGQ